jgi:hypothetical protein
MKSRILLAALLVAGAFVFASAQDAQAFTLFGGGGCGCDAAPACGCDAAPACGCESDCGCDRGCRVKRCRKPWFQRCCKSRCESSCGCDSAPACGCEG